MECRIKPIRDGNLQLLKDFDDYFKEIVSVIIPLSGEVIDLATEIRARHEFKTPDQFTSLRPVHQNAMCFSAMITDSIDSKASMSKLSSDPKHPN